MLIAFFSRAISARAISNSSADQVQVTLFTSSAASQIVGDLKQELQSRSVSLGNAPSNNKLYLPVGPYSVGVNPGGKVNGATPGIRNVVKRSIAGEAFFDNTSPATASYPSGTPIPHQLPHSRRHHDLLLCERALRVARTLEQGAAHPHVSPGS